MTGGEYLSQTDTIMWTVESDPLLRSTILGIALLERRADWDALQERMERVTRHIPALRQKVVPVPLHPMTLRWEDDPDFDLDYHLRRVALPPSDGLRGLLDFAAHAARGGFDRTRPLWEFTLVDGVEGEDGDRSALVMKAHHVLTDGIGSVQLAAHLFDFDVAADPLGPEPSSAASSARLGLLGQVVDAVAHDVEGVTDFARRNLASALPTLLDALRHPQRAMAETVETLRSVGRVVQPVFDTLSPVMTERRRSSTFSTVTVPLEDLRAAGHAAGGTVNDGFLAGITGGLRRYHEHHGAEVDELRAAMPISLRSEDDDVGGNHVTVLRFKVPISLPDPAERVRAMHRVAAEQRAQKSLPHTETIAGFLNLLPKGSIGTMLKHVDFLASNVPGVPTPMYLTGVQVERFYPFGPTAGSSVNVTLMSYNGECCIGVHTDDGAIPDADVFLECIHAGFDEVLSLRS